MIIPIHIINHDIYRETIKQKRLNKKLIVVSGVCCSSILRDYGCVFCSISMLFIYMYVRMSSNPRSIAGGPSGRALPVFPINAPHLCAFLV
jgi:hypothetical protein